MIAFGHSSVGAIIGAGVAVAAAPTTSPLVKIVVVVVLGIISHYIFDAIPHGHYNFSYKKMSHNKNLWIFLLDTIGAFLALSLVTYLAVGASLSLLLVIVGMLAALLPDIWEAGVDLGIIPKRRIAKVHRHFHFNFIHWHSDKHSSLPNHARMWSITDVWQVIVFIVALLLVATLPKP